MGEFVQARLISDNENFWAPLKKINIKTFQSLNKRIKVGNLSTVFIFISCKEKDY